MNKVAREPKNFRYVFSNKFTPLLTVKPGEEFLLETEDAFEGKIREKTQLPVASLLPGLHRFPPYLNPLCGPIYIEGAERGDLLAVTIHDIEPQEQGVSVIIEGFGPLADSASWPECHGPFTRILPYERGKSGKFKDMLSGERDPDEIPPEEREMVQKLIDDTYGKFKSVVAEGRGNAHNKNKGNKDPQDQGKPLGSDWTDYADGRVLSGKEAQDLGFVDQVGTFEDSVRRAERIAGVSKANLVEYQQRFDLSDFFKMFGNTKVPAIKVDLGVEGPKLEAGQMYFLSPTFAK